MWIKSWSWIILQTRFNLNLYHRQMIVYDNNPDPYSKRSYSILDQSEFVFIEIIFIFMEIIFILDESRFILDECTFTLAGFNFICRWIFIYFIMKLDPYSQTGSIFSDRIIFWNSMHLNRIHIPWADRFVGQIAFPWHCNRILVLCIQWHLWQWIHFHSKTGSMIRTRI